MAALNHAYDEAKAPSGKGSRGGSKAGAGASGNNQKQMAAAKFLVNMVKCVRAWLQVYSIYIQRSSVACFGGSSRPPPL